MKNHSDLVQRALAARTNDDVIALQAGIEGAVGVRHERPVGDRWNNVGLLTASGSSYDHKVLELATNMSDAVVELAALLKYKDREKVPYTTPHEAAKDLFKGIDTKDLADRCCIQLFDAGHGKRRVTIAMRDAGVGLRPDMVPLTIFQVGSSHKDGMDWLQGNFGLGGATTYRNAEAVIVVTRRHPDLLEPGQEDRVSIAVVQWERKRTTENAFYLTTTEWTGPGDEAEPFSVPASEVNFDPGTYIALISYGTEGLARRSGDERSLDTVFNTRLYRPVLPTTYQNNLVRDRWETLVGLERRLDDNPGPPEFEGSDVLPFSHGGTTYLLPIRFRIFAKRGEAGERRNFIAHGHTLVITSNGQVHNHWEPQDFKLRTHLRKLYDRVFVVVDSNELPIELRTTLFTADRSQIVRTDPALRLEKEIAGFLDEWAALVDANSALIREAITGNDSDRSTLEVARKIARALKVKGFSTGAGGTGGGGGGGGGRKPPKPTPPEDLYDDPTHFEGPFDVEAAVGKARGIYLKLNAKDGFIPNRGTLTVTCDHPDISDNELTAGELSGGRVRVSVAVPEDADLGMFELHAAVDDWQKSSGGLGTRFEWTTKVNIVAEVTPKPPPVGANGKGKNGPGKGDLVALLWRTDDEQDEWDATTVGDIEMVPGTDLAAARTEYAELASIADEIPTIVLNRTHSPLKAYLQARSAELTDEGVDQAADRYAVGVGVALLMLHQQQLRDEKAGVATNDPMMRMSQQAAARAVLSVLPDYDRLAREIED